MRNNNNYLLTGQELQHAGGYQIRVRSLPAASDAGEERKEQEEEGRDEQRDCRTRHVQAFPSLFGEVVGDLVFGDVVVDVDAVGLRGRYVRLDCERNETRKRCKITKNVRERVCLIT